MKTLQKNCVVFCFVHHCVGCKFVLKFIWNAIAIRNVIDVRDAIAKLDWRKCDSHLYRVKWWFDRNVCIKWDILCTISSNYLSCVWLSQHTGAISRYITDALRACICPMMIYSEMCARCVCIGDELYDHHIICAIIVALRLVCHSPIQCVVVPTAAHTHDSIAEPANNNNAAHTAKRVLVS